ncbi:MAG TPA: hypothetical protein VLA82_00700 [Actinomycetota bacterium]|nr:hypothetical protein [Actinomycetota bacterium]
MTRRDATTDDDGVAEPIAKGLIRAWLLAKLAPIVVRLATWAAWCGALVGYAGYVAWRVRRLAKKGALDEPTPGGPPTPVSARERGVLAWIRGDEPLVGTTDAAAKADEPVPVD